MLERVWIFACEGSLRFSNIALLTYCKLATKIKESLNRQGVSKLLIVLPDLNFQRAIKVVKGGGRVMSGRRTKAKSSNSGFVSYGIFLAVIVPLAIAAAGGIGGSFLSLSSRIDGIDNGLDERFDRVYQAIIQQTNSGIDQDISVVFEEEEANFATKDAISGEWLGRFPEIMLSLKEKLQISTLDFSNADELIIAENSSPIIFVGKADSPITERLMKRPGWEEIHMKGYYAPEANDLVGYCILVSESLAQKGYANAIRSVLNELPESIWHLP